MSRILFARIPLPRFPLAGGLYTPMNFPITSISRSSNTLTHTHAHARARTHTHTHTHTLECTHTFRISNCIGFITRKTESDPDTISNETVIELFHSRNNIRQIKKDFAGSPARAVSRFRVKRRDPHDSIRFNGKTSSTFLCTRGIQLLKTKKSR